MVINTIEETMATYAAVGKELDEFVENKVDNDNSSWMEEGDDGLMAVFSIQPMDTMMHIEDNNDVKVINLIEIDDDDNDIEIVDVINID